MAHWRVSHRYHSRSSCTILWLAVNTSIWQWTGCTCSPEVIAECMSKDHHNLQSQAVHQTNACGGGGNWWKTLCKPDLIMASTGCPALEAYVDAQIAPQYMHHHSSMCPDIHSSNAQAVACSRHCRQQIICSSNPLVLEESLDTGYYLLQTLHTQDVHELAGQPLVLWVHLIQAS